MVTISRNPIYSVLFLISAFFSSSNILFFIGLDYLSLTILIIYVGAISVLFLFILMMTNLGIFDLNQRSFNVIPLLLILSTWFIFKILTFLSYNFSSLNFSHPHFLSNYEQISEIFFINFYVINSHIKNLGVLIYCEFPIFLVLAGILLLLAMVGTIYISLKKSYQNKLQIVNNQVLRKDFISKNK